MDNQQKNSRKGWTEDEIDYLKTNYIFRDRNNNTKIAAALGRSRKSVEHKIHQLGITNIGHVKKYQDCAMKIKEPSPYLAYVLGVYLSDGWTHKGVFELHSMDKDYCEAVIECLDNILDGEYNRTVRQNKMEKLNKNKEIKYTSDQYRIRIRSVDLCAWLEIKTNRKQTIPQEYIDKYPKELLSGLMDGDGSIGISKKHAHIYGGYSLTLCGHKYLYKAVNKYPAIFEKLNIKYKEHINKTTCVGLVIYTLDKKDFLSSGCEFRIQRKQDRINKLREILNDHPGTS